MKQIAIKLPTEENAHHFAVTDAIHNLIHSALLNASPRDFGEFENSNDGMIYIVDGITIDLIER